jgi:hypothetical protein
MGLQNNIHVWSPEIEELYGVAPGEFGSGYESWESLLLPEDLEKARGCHSGVVAHWGVPIGVADSPPQRWPDSLARGPAHWFFSTTRGGRRRCSASTWT